MTESRFKALLMMGIFAISVSREGALNTAEPIISNRMRIAIEQNTTIPSEMPMRKITHAMAPIENENNATKTMSAIGLIFPCKRNLLKNTSRLGWLKLKTWQWMS
jgi:hypothetical protein